MSKRFKRSKNAVNVNPMDELIFRKVNEECDTIKSLIKRYKKDFKTIPELSEDVFESLYKIDPKIKEESEMNSEFIMNHALMNHSFELDDYKMLHGYTKGDEFSSTVCGEVITEELMLFHKEVEEEIQEALSEIKADLEGKGVSESKIKGKIQAAHDKMYKAKVKGEIEDVMRRAVRSALKKQDEMSNLEHAWGRESGNEQKLSFKEKVEIAERLEKEPKLKKITEKAGRMRNVALSARKSRIAPGTSEVHDIKQGDDLARVLPTELAMAHVEEFYMLFMKKLACSELLEYELIDREFTERGPIIICIDNSGSMSGDPEIWSKAIAVGMLELAFKDKRELIVNHFGSEIDDIKKFVFKPGENNTMKLIDMASFFLGGGTDFIKPLNESRNDINERLPDADIVFITDGICDVNDARLKKFMEWKKENKVRIYSFLVDFFNNSLDILYKFSDYAMPSSYLADDNKTELDLYKKI